MDDTVSWLPPSHPKAAITKSAASLRKELEALLPEIDETEENNMSIFIEGMNIEFPIPQVKKPYRFSCAHKYNSHFSPADGENNRTRTTKGITCEET